MQHLYHSSVDGYLDCFHVFAVINSAAVDIGIHVFLFELRLFLFFELYAQEWPYWIYLFIGGLFLVF